MEIKGSVSIILFIIMLVIISQLALSIYLPSMPYLVGFFHTDIELIKLSLTIYLLGYGISQFFYGPLSDIYGRRRIILVGVSIFIFACIVCVSAVNIYSFLVGRLFQGMGIGCADTMGRAILCDRFKGHKFVRAASYINLAGSITPLTGPLLGSYVEVYFSWKINFLIICLYAFSALLIFYLYLPETKPSHIDVSTKPSQILKTYLSILKDKTFINFFIPGAACFLGETSYNLISSFLLQNQLSWGPVGFGWLNVCTVVGLMTGISASHLFAAKVNYQKMVSIGMLIITVSAICMLLPALFRVLNTAVVICPMTIFMVGVGIIYPNTNNGALSPFADMAGTAGALQGGLQMILGGTLGFLLSQISTQNQLLLALTLTIVTLVSYTIFVLLLNLRNDL